MFLCERSHVDNYLNIYISIEFMQSLAACTNSISEQKNYYYRILHKM